MNDVQSILSRAITLTSFSSTLSTIKLADNATWHKRKSNRAVSCLCLTYQPYQISTPSFLGKKILIDDTKNASVPSLTTNLTHRASHGTKINIYSLQFQHLGIQPVIQLNQTQAIVEA